MIGEDDAAGEGDFEALAEAEGGGEDACRGKSKFCRLSETVQRGAVVGDGLWRKSRLQNISRLRPDVLRCRSGSHVGEGEARVYTRSTSGREEDGVGDSWVRRRARPSVNEGEEAIYLTYGHRLYCVTPIDLPIDTSRGISSGRGTCLNPRATTSGRDNYCSIDG
jgi:hypothetical protein